MAADKLKILVVDDSPLVRQVLKNLLLENENIGEVEVASNGEIALRRVAKKDPDIVLCDIEMPGMDGVQTTERIMADYPRPIILMSAYTGKGAEKTIRALEAGAVDFVGLPAGRLTKDIVQVGDELISKIRAITSGLNKRNRMQNAIKGDRPARQAVSRRVAMPASEVFPSERVIAIGASTGGTGAIKRILETLPEDIKAGIVIVQHMPEGFTASFAERLNELCPPFVKEAENKDIIADGRVLLAPGHSHMVVQKGEYGNFVTLNKSPRIHGVRPAVDPLFASVADVFGSNAIGVICTGMGRDGATGLGRMQDRGAYTIAQDEASCVVFGMPKVAIAEGAVKKVLSLKEIGPILRGMIK